MDSCKKKVLLLSSHDSHLQDHAWSCMKLYDTNKYEVGLVSLYSLYGDKTHALIPNSFIYRVLNKILISIDNLFAKKNRRYSYYRLLSFPITAKQILNKCSLGNPDIIVLHWYDGFVTPRIIKRLHELTSAKIVFALTDEFSLGGGCHYPCECDKYMTLCSHCPALLNHKGIVERKHRKSIELLRSIPKVVIAPSAGIKKAQQSAIFRNNTTFIKEIRGHKIDKLPTFEMCRHKWGINNEDFVIMFGAANLSEERKGIQLLLSALEIVSTKVDRKIIAVVVGNASCRLPKLRNIEYVFTGVLPLEKLYEAYVLSNVYISPSIADAGPMMLKFSIACGTPAVAFPIGYSLDFIIHKETGYLADMFSVDSLAEGILFFYNNQLLRNHFSDKCRILNENALKNSCVYNSL